MKLITTRSGSAHRAGKVYSAVVPLNKGDADGGWGVGTRVGLAESVYIGDVTVSAGMVGGIRGVDVLFAPTL